MTFYNNYNIENIFYGGNNKYKKIGDLKLSVNEVSKYILDNGIRLLEIPMNSNLFAAGIYVNVGSRDETDPKSYGIAHFLEHMTFKGTKTKTTDEINLLLDNYGANVNATTTIDYTSYYLTGNPNDSVNLLDILLDIYCNPVFPEEDIHNERLVVLEEWRMNLDNKKRQLLENIFKYCYDDINDDTFKRPIIGYEKTITNFTREDILKFRKKYTYNKTIIIISGLYNNKKIFNLIKKYFNCDIKKSEIPGYKEKIENTIKIKNTYINPQIIKIKSNAKQLKIYLCFKTVNIFNKYTDTINIISNYLTSGFSSKFFNLLRNKLGVSYSCNSYYFGQKECGIFIIEFGIDYVHIFNTIEEMLKILKNLCIENITENDLNIIKKKSETELLFGFREPLEYIDHYGYIEIYKKPHVNIIDMYKNIQNESIFNIKKLAKKMFRKKNFILGIIGNIKSNVNTKLIKFINNDELFYK